MSYGRIIRDLRISKSTYDRRSFALLLGISTSQLEDMETSKTIPSNNIIAKMANLLKVHNGYLHQLVMENLPSSTLPQRQEFYQYLDNMPRKI